MESEPGVLVSDSLFSVFENFGFRTTGFSFQIACFSFRLMVLSFRITAPPDGKVPSNTTSSLRARRQNSSHGGATPLTVSGGHLTLRPQPSDARVHSARK